MTSTDAVSDAPHQAQAQPTGQATVGQRLMAAAFWSGGVFFRLLPRALAYGVARLLAFPLLVITLRREQRLVAAGRGMRRNLRIVFRDALTPERERWMFRHWARHMIYSFVDFFRLPLITQDNLSERVECQALNTVRQCLAEGRGVLLVTSHAGVWEALGHSVALSGIPVTSLARPFDNPIIDGMVERIRHRGGQETLPKWGALWKVKNALKAGRAVQIVADENVPDRPEFTSFLGTTASTSRAIAQLHLMTGAPIVFLACHRRRKPGFFRLRTFGVVRYARSSDKDADARALMQIIADAVGRIILSNPPQWLWGSRRYKNRPEHEELGADGLPLVTGRQREEITRAAEGMV